jgi:hypothetical protein
MTFTDKPPTRPGAYWWKSCETARPLLRLVDEPAEYVGNHGLWCGPLVPAEEVERAYLEGCNDGTLAMAGLLESNIDKLFADSRAKRVMEGAE